jgi:hypothetical protein
VALPVSAGQVAQADQRAGEVQEGEHTSSVAVVADRQLAVGEQPDEGARGFGREERVDRLPDVVAVGSFEATAGHPPPGPPTARSRYGRSRI